MVFYSSVSMFMASATIG